MKLLTNHKQMSIYAATHEMCGQAARQRLRVLGKDDEAKRHAVGYSSQIVTSMCTGLLGHIMQMRSVQTTAKLS